VEKGTGAELYPEPKPHCAATDAFQWTLASGDAIAFANLLFLLPLLRDE
jgi:hypothetical protein